MITPFAKDWFERLNLTENALNSFALHNKDYLTFIYSNDFLPSQAQNLTLYMTIQQQSSSATKLQSVPRLLFKVCQYQSADDCYLSEQQSISINSMTSLGVSDDLSKTRLAVIAH